MGHLEPGERLALLGAEGSSARSPLGAARCADLRLSAHGEPLRSAARAPRSDSGAAPRGAPRRRPPRPCRPSPALPDAWACGPTSGGPACPAVSIAVWKGWYAWSHIVASHGRARSRVDPHPGLGGPLTLDPAVWRCLVRAFLAGRTCSRSPPAVWPQCRRPCRTGATAGWLGRSGYSILVGRSVPSPSLHAFAQVRWPLWPLASVRTVIRSSGIHHEYTSDTQLDSTNFTGKEAALVISLQDIELGSSSRCSHCPQPLAIVIGLKIQHKDRRLNIQHMIWLSVKHGMIVCTLGIKFGLDHVTFGSNTTSFSLCR
ncbi:hypothetical protein U9M48_017200 [Paspalum notatum var. saurae]|uniref:Uncharacterized protein n=1 Tax=Paspalum notatum var. saurae TaxID=547442 RepID=A0AAQ3T8Y6_PASNO